MAAIVAKVIVTTVNGADIVVAPDINLPPTACINTKQGSKQVPVNILFELDDQTTENRRYRFPNDKDSNYGISTTVPDFFENAWRPDRWDVLVQDNNSAGVDAYYRVTVVDKNGNSIHSDPRVRNGGVAN